MFHALHKVDMGACYAKQKINLACPYMINYNEMEAENEKQIK